MLSKVGKGWFSIHETNPDTYRQAHKLRGCVHPVLSDGMVLEGVRRYKLESSCSRFAATLGPIFGPKTEPEIGSSLRSSRPSFEANFWPQNGGQAKLNNCANPGRHEVLCDVTTAVDMMCG